MADTFSYIDNVFMKTNPVTSTSNQLDEKENYYMVSRWMSTHPLSFAGAYRISQYSSRMPRWAVGCALYHSVLRKGRAPKLIYIKKDSKEIDKELLEKVRTFFNCSDKYAEEIITIFYGNNINLRQSFGLKGEK